MNKPTETSLTLFHGGKMHNGLADDQVFFSTCQTFSKRYGEVGEYEVTFNHVFDVCNRDHVERLLSCVGTIYDSYEDKEYSRYEELEADNLLAHDDWGLFEPFLPVLQEMGFDGLRIFEGGNENYVTLNKNQYRLLKILEPATTATI